VSTRSSAVVRWLSITLPALAVILVPFFLFGTRMDAWATTVLEQKSTASLAFAAVVLLLASDVALPIPSSVVSTMAGALLGGPLGALASWLGMTLGCALGYALGALAGRPVLGRLTSAVSMVAFEHDMARYGAGLVAVGRAVPVLAEATTLIAGATRMPLSRFFAVASLANLAISAVYAAVGAVSAQVDSFLLAASGAILLPGIAWWVLGKLWPKHPSVSANYRQ